MRGADVRDLDWNLDSEDVQGVLGVSDDVDLGHTGFRSDGPERRDTAVRWPRFRFGLAPGGVRAEIHMRAACRLPSSYVRPYYKKSTSRTPRPPTLLLLSLRPLFIMAQVIVVGGGLAGLSAAHTLLERGANVLMLDKQP